MIKKLIQFLMSLFGKKKTDAEQVSPAPSQPVVTPTTTLVKPDTRSTNGLDFDAIPEGWTLFDVVRRVGRELTAVEYAFLEAKYGMKHAAPVAPVGSFDNRGGDLNGGVVRVNQVSAGQSFTYNITIVPGAASFKLNVFGAPGSFFNEAGYTMRDAGGAVVHSQPMTQFAGTLGTGYDWVDIAPGDYTIEVTVNGSGMLGAQFHQWNAVGGYAA